MWWMSVFLLIRPQGHTFFFKKNSTVATRKYEYQYQWQSYLGTMGKSPHLPTQTICESTGRGLDMWSHSNGNYACTALSAGGREDSKLIRIPMFSGREQWIKPECTSPHETFPPKINQQHLFYLLILSVETVLSNFQLSEIRIVIFIKSLVTLLSYKQKYSVTKIIIN